MHETLYCGYQLPSLLERNAPQLPSPLALVGQGGQGCIFKVITLRNFPALETGRTPQDHFRLIGM